MESRRVTIETVSIKDPKTGEKNGKPWKLWNAGIKVGDEWHNSTLWSEDEVQKLQSLEGKATDLYFFSEEYNGKEYSKFRMPKQIELLEVRTGRLEAFAKVAIARFPELEQPFLEAIK